jgi:hypothetical protein
MAPEHSYIFSSKKSYIKKSLLFIVLVFTVGWLFQYFFEKKIILTSPSSSAYKINRILNYTYENEIPIFGASRAEGTFIPSLLGKDFFNYGISGTREDVQLFFLEQECKKNKKNPYILLTFEVEGYTNGLGDLNTYLLNINNKDIRSLVGDNYRWYYKIPFVKYFGKYESFFKDYLNERMMLTKYKENGATIEKDEITKEKFDYLVDERKNTEGEFKNDSSLEKRFIQLFNAYPNRKFIIIIPPYHPSCFARFKNYNDVQNYLSYLSKFPNISVLDYSHNFYPDNYYMNTSHLNYKGACVFNNMLKDTLQKIFVR